MMNWMKKGALVLVLAAVAGALAIVPAAQPREAEADPVGVVGLNSAICATLGIAFGGLEDVDAVSNCANLPQQSTVTGVQRYVACLRGQDQPRILDPSDATDADLIDLGYPNPIPADGKKECGEGVDFDDNGLIHPTPEDFAALDLDANQVHAGQQLFVIAFIDDEASVRFKTDAGEFFQSGGSSYICTTQDPDCDEDPSTPGDGVVIATLIVDQDVEPGTYGLVAIHEAIGWPMDFTVTGVPDEIVLEPLFGKPNLSVGATPPTVSLAPNPDDPNPGDGTWETIPGPPAEPTDCNFAATVDGVLGANSSGEKMVLVAKAIDSDGNEVAGALFDWNLVYVDDDLNEFTPSVPVSDTLSVSTPTTPTIDTGALGIGFPQFLCGIEDPGTVTLIANFSDLGGLDPRADSSETAEIEITVIGEPANLSLTVDPPTLACDGTATAAVTANVTTADGDPVSNGTDITWNVQVLGTVSPLSGDITDGKATANVKPFAGANIGVPVIATVGDLQASALVQCGAGSAPPVPGASPVAPGGGTAPGSGAPGGTVRPPDTGTGGDLDGRAALNVWGAVALFAGAMGLIGARLAIRRID